MLFSGARYYATVLLLCLFSWTSQGWAKATMFQEDAGAYNCIIADGTAGSQAQLANCMAAAAAMGSSMPMLLGPYGPPVTGNKTGVKISWTITSNLTITQPIIVPFSAKIVVNNGVTLTLTGCPAAGEYQIIDVSAGGILRYNSCGFFNILWTGADPTGGADSTAAINAATQAGRAWNELALQTVIYAPAGQYKILGTVEVHLSQHFKGAGAQTTYFIGSNSATDDMIKVGENDAGIGVCQISDFGVRSFSSQGAGHSAIHNFFSGNMIHDLFISNSEIGLELQGAGVMAYNLIFDDVGQTAIAMHNLHSSSLSNILIYIYNFGISIGSYVNDVEINGITTLYTRFAHVDLQDGASWIRGVRIHNWIGSYTDVFGGDFVAFLRNRASNVHLFVDGFTMYNPLGAAIKLEAGTDVEITLSNGTIDGRISNVSYTPTADPQGIRHATGELNMENIHFKELNGPDLVTEGTAPVRVYWHGGTTKAKDGASSITNHVDRGNTNASNVYAFWDVEVRDVLPLYSATGTGLVYWDGAYQNVGYLGDASFVAMGRAAGDVAYKALENVSLEAGTGASASVRANGSTVLIGKSGGATRLVPLPSPPASAEPGDLYMDSSGALCVHTGAAWEKVNTTGDCS